MIQTSTTVPRPRRPLIAARWTAVAIAVVAFGLLAIMAFGLHDTRDPTRFDDTVDTWLHDHTGTLVQQALLALTEPVLTIGIVIVVTVVAALMRRTEVATLAAIGPVVALTLESEVLKPWINRLYGLAEELTNGGVQAGYAFPSGHETGLAAVTTLLTILLLRADVTRNTRMGGCAVAGLWTVLGAVGLVRSAYHYATDTVGGILLGVGVIVTTAVLVDVVADLVAGRRVSSPGAHARPRTPHGV